jgi:hypothetical protein
VEAADVFGFVEDKQGNSAVTVNPTGTSRTVLAGYGAAIPPGASTIRFVVTAFRCVQQGYKRFSPTARFQHLIALHFN